MKDKSKIARKFTIVMPVYNCEKFVEEGIVSVLCQSYRNFELIVVDDGSTDSTHEIVTRISDVRLKKIRQNNRGQANALNHGWSIASGDILAYLSADDRLLPHALETVADAFNQGEDIDIIYGDYEYIDEESRIIRPVKLKEMSHREMIAGLKCNPGPGAFWKREVYEKVGGWNESLRQVPDYEYWIRAGLHGKFKHLNNTLAQFRVHKNSQTYSKSDFAKADESVRVITNFFLADDLPKEIQALQPEAVASAAIYSASLHLGAGRFSIGLKTVFNALVQHPQSMLDSFQIKRILSGIIKSVR